MLKVIVKALLGQDSGPDEGKNKGHGTGVSNATIYVTTQTMLIAMTKAFIQATVGVILVTTVIMAVILATVQVTMVIMWVIQATVQVTVVMMGVIQAMITMVMIVVMGMMIQTDCLLLTLPITMEDAVPGTTFETLPDHLKKHSKMF